ncbi:hypothetical protein [Halorubrum sp. DTA98]|uniref:hypothetical protein n=1 Tax=Halorubrum sp. DTA98 TaxID=3402163 RepID=UPI003AB0D1A9
MHGDDVGGPRDPLEAAVRERRIDDPDRGPGPRVSRVPEPHVNDTFDVDGIDTKRRESLLEALLAARDDVSAASATERNGTVGIHHDPSVSRDELRAELESYGLVVAPGDEAFASRRAAQFDSARVAVAVLFGLMVAVPYVGVLYPTRVEWLFYDPVTVAYLQSILDSRVATHFFVNLAALSGVAFLVACGPTIRRSVAAVKAGRPTNEAAFVVGVLAVYGYSTLAAFTGFGGTVHYDLVAYAVVGATLWTHFDVDSATTGTDDARSTTPAAPDTTDEEDPIALTDGGRH